MSGKLCVNGLEQIFFLFLPILIELGEAPGDDTKHLLNVNHIGVKGYLPTFKQNLHGLRDFLFVNAAVGELEEVFNGEN